LLITVMREANACGGGAQHGADGPDPDIAARVKNAGALQDGVLQVVYAASRRG
jgi:hypothetical protein